MLAPHVVPDSTKSDALAPVTAMLLMVRGAPGPFDSVTVWGALVLPIEAPGKLRLAGETDAVAGVTPPTPESATVCGLLAAESVKVRVAVRVPAAVGLKTRVAVQLAFTERLAPQVVPETTKSDALAPVTATLLIVMGEVFPFESVTACEAEPDPTAVLANARLEGLAATTPLVPRPLRATVCGLLESESLKLRIAVRVPVPVGPKTMFAVQLAPAASVAPQVLLKTVKSARLPPLILMPLILMAAALELVSVATFWPPLLPMATAAHDKLPGEVVAAFALVAAASGNKTTEARPASFLMLRGGFCRPREELRGNSFDGKVWTDLTSRHNA
jgi:hypothetical protein